MAHRIRSLPVPAAAASEPMTMPAEVRAEIERSISLPYDRAVVTHIALIAMRAAALECAKICQNVDQITLFTGHPIDSEDAVHSLVRDIVFLKAQEIKAYAASLEEKRDG